MTLVGHCAIKRPLNVLRALRRGLCRVYASRRVLQQQLNMYTGPAAADSTHTFYNIYGVCVYTRLGEKESMEEAMAAAAGPYLL